MIYVSKQFLSESANESGSIVCTVETAKYENMSHYRAERGPSIDASLRLSDCSEHVIIDFNAHSQSSFEKRLKKIDKLMDEVVLFRNKYIEMWELHNEDIAKKLVEVENEHD